ncbi:MAG: hypothetical protein Q7I97_09965 [Thermovirgaceae bacterium]|nr:hypothetical protein [Thermovirgaceae bacterium]
MRQNGFRTIGASLAMLFLFATGAFAAMGDVQNFTFNGFGPTDLVSAGEVSQPDGNPDARFSATISGVGALSGLLLKSEEDGTVWDTTPGNQIWGMHVKDSSGNVLTESSGRLSLVPFIMGLNIELAVADNGAIARGGTFTLTARFIDNSENSATLTVPPSYTSNTTSSQSSGLKAAYMGEGDRDIAGSNETRAGNGKRDWRVDMNLGLPGTVTGMKIKNVKGPAGEWDTIPKNGKWLLAVTQPNGSILNNPDGSINLSVSKASDIVLWLENNGSLDKAETRSLLTVTYDDGRLFETEIQPYSTATVSGSGDFLEARLVGTGNVDLVGKNENLRGDQSRDSRFDIKFRGTGTVNSIRLVNLTKGGEWDTIPNNGKWLIAVRQPGGSVLNASNGSVRLSVNGTASLELWVEDNGTLGNEASAFRITIAFSDGSVLEKEIPAGEGGNQLQVDSDKRELALSGPRQASSSDYVGPYDRLKKNGTNDWYFNLKIKGKGTIKAMTLKNVGASGEWDTIPGNGRWTLAVRGKGNRLLNNSDGSVGFSVPPNHDIHLFVENNGTLQLSKSSYELIVTWDDGTKSTVSVR